MLDVTALEEHFIMLSLPQLPQIRQSPQLTIRHSQSLLQLVQLLQLFTEAEKAADCLARRVRGEEWEEMYWY